MKNKRLIKIGSGIAFALGVGGIVIYGGAWQIVFTALMGVVFTGTLVKSQTA